jgi:heme-degrading monooxygenase HmoA
MSADFAATPSPPYYAVIFSSLRAEGDDGYGDAARELFAEVSKIEGFLGVESIRGANGFGITTAYFADEAAILRWREDARHKVAQERGKTGWYSHYSVRIGRIERAYEGPEGR